MMFYLALLKLLTTLSRTRTAVLDQIFYISHALRASILLTVFVAVSPSRRITTAANVQYHSCVNPLLNGMRRGNEIQACRRSGPGEIPLMTIIAVLWSKPPKRQAFTSCLSALSAARAGKEGTAQEDRGQDEDAL